MGIYFLEPSDDNPLLVVNGGIPLKLIVDLTSFFINFLFSCKFVLASGLLEDIRNLS